jgi:hypothetical protein
MYDFSKSLVEANLAQNAAEKKKKESKKLAPIKIILITIFLTVPYIGPRLCLHLHTNSNSCRSFYSSS